MTKRLSPRIRSSIGWAIVCTMTTAFFGSAATDAFGQATTIRPIEDFVSQQGTYCFDLAGTGDCFLFTPPVGNFYGSSDGDDGISISVDYAGLADQWIQTESGGTQSLGTEFSGTIRERPLKDGRAEVKVNLHTRNALTWAVDGFDYGNDPLVFGNRAPDVIAGATPSFSDGVFQFSFINTAPGDPLPDLLQLAVDPLPGQEDISDFKMRFSGQGLTHANERLGLEDGGLAQVKVSQTGLFGTSANPGSALEDGFPVENIIIQPIGAGPRLVPEPSGVAMFALGLLGLLQIRSSRHRT